MAPVKNPNSSNKNATNSNSINSNTTRPSSNGAHIATTVANATNCTSGQRKQTGTVPKALTKASINTNTAPCGAQQQQNGQKTLFQPSGVSQMANRCSPLNIVASIQQHQQPQNIRSQQQHKNTEIVAPIRRELKDLNDYLLTTVVTTANNTNNLNNQQQQQLQQLQTTTNQQQLSNTTAANSDFENSQENQQRFCYPVRPIPRRNQQQHNNNQQTQNDFLNSTQNSNTNLNTTIGVVIPTTPGLPTTSNTALSTVQPVSTNNSAAALNENSLLGPQFEQHLQLLVVQRLKQLFENSQTQPFLNLTSNLLPTLQSSTSANLATAVLNHNSNDFNQLALRFQQALNNNNNNHKVHLENSVQAQQKKTSTMVHEIPPNTANREVVVNSNSLEDVPLSETSDRAQSIQSLHSNMETPTPDNTPSYEELQQRLEASNRNIQNMQEQQQQLLKLQNAAKQHLSDMEKLRQQAQTLSFPSGSQRNADDGGGDGAPDYQSIDQVHSDMASLVGRMKNLTTFIQNQNELSTLMGDDGPEILAEQELLQRKLEALRAQRDEMRHLVSELQTVNRSAEETAKEARQRQYEQEKDVEENEHQNSPKMQSNNEKQANIGKEREVPIEYSRNVPIELLHQAQRQQLPNTNAQALSESEVDGEIDGEEDEEQRKIAAVIIQQKVADIDAMKAQLKRLKEMMETVNLIESHTAKDPKLIGRTPSREVPIAYDRERTPVAEPSRYQDDSGNEEFIARKVRMLNEVTSDLRAQAQSLQSEKDRIQALKNEIERRKQQAAAAVQLGEDALKRNSLTPTPVPRDHNSRWEEHQKTQQERDQLKLEYEIKKKEFELLCKRLKEEEEPTSSNRRQDIVSEADDEAEEDNNDSDYAASTKFVPTSTAAVTRTTDQSNRNVKDSLNSTGASSNTATHVAQAASSTHDGASLEGASMQSGSSRSFSIPPPMSAMGMNFPGPIPPPLPNAWNPHQYYYATGVPPPPPPPQNSFGLNQSSANTATINPSECICNANNLGAATSSSTATSGTTNALLSTNDPMLQQFIQTQQMLINSVCQCNQMLWHQQREIDSLNQTIHMLQERLLAITTGGNVNAATNTNEGSYHLRSESVPPPTMVGIPTTQALPNNLYVGINRAQSEQPIPFIPGQTRNSAFSNYQQQQQHVYRHQRVSQQPQGGFNFTTETQQHNTSASATSNMYATLNNAATQPAPQAPSTHFNNEMPTPQSPVVGSGPAPIFMHHHNNAIHQNNANLRTQNQQQQHHHHHHSNLSHTLNNQVPPGNRANNYWDNFRR